MVRVDREIRTLSDGAAIANRAAQEFVQAAAAAVREKGAFNVALAGGSTPKALYSLLSTDPAFRSQVPWDKIHVFFGDERHVGPDHPDSNFRMGTKALHAGARIVVRNWVGKLYADRITLTAPAAGNAARIIFMVTGADKAPALKGVLEGPYEPEQLPAQLLQPKNGKLLWLVDTAAGGMLSTGIRE